jgi:AraC family cel operon transcriptional repressor
MRVIKLYSASFMNYPERGPASYITSKTQLKVCHTHDYYEIFLVDQGMGIHRINGQKQPIAAGFLGFIRPRDIHYYDAVSANFRIINIIIPEEIIGALFRFLGPGYEEDRLLSPALPSSVNLDFSELTALIRKLEQLILYKKIMKTVSDTAYRMTIFDIMTKYFTANRFDKTAGQVPQWLHWLSLEMLKAENFKKGLPMLYKLSGKSPEHLSRSCRKYLQKTPSRLVNDIRLEHGAKLLTTTNIPIIEICENCGFESLSYFYHRFKEHYGLSPKEFRTKGKEDQVYLMGDLSVKAEIPIAIPLDEVRGRERPGVFSGP